MRIVLVSVVISLFAHFASGQSILYTFIDESQDALSIGWYVSDAGDVNGDGYSDVIVGDFGGDANGENSGSAFVFSGIDGITLYSFHGDQAGDVLGRSVSDAGDVNGDGYADLIVGMPGDDVTGTDTGSARVFSGADGSILHTSPGLTLGAGFGATVSGAGDVNGDGYADIAAGVASHASTIRPGYIRVISGKDGAGLYIYFEESADDWFGWTVSDAGDVNGDGYPDIIAGAPGQRPSGSGFVRLYSGKDGSVLNTLNAAAIGDQFGWAVSGAGDVNGDGYADIVTGAPYAYSDPDGTLGNGDDVNRAGRMIVHSGKDSSVLHIFEGISQSAHLGWSVSDAGDLNNDGFPDLIGASLHAGFSLPNLGSVGVFSGKDGSTIYTMARPLPVGGGFTPCVSGGGDMNGDGCPDFIVGASDAGGLFGPLQAYAVSVSGKTLPLTTDTHLMSVGEASSQSFFVDAGLSNALKSYWIFTNFAASGTTPGVTLTPGVTIPLNPDALTGIVINLTLLGGGAPTFVGWKGTLDASGQATASVNTQGPVPVPIGITSYRAALVYTAGGCGAGCDTFQLATNTVPMTTVP